MVTDQVDFVVGVDTHADRHALAVVDAGTQQTCRQLTVAASRQGYRQALRLAKRHAPGRRAWALEGSGCYGAGLARFLNQQGERVESWGQVFFVPPVASADELRRPSPQAWTRRWTVVTEQPRWVAISRKL